jgi:hypothetical protein
MNKDLFPEDNFILLCARTELSEGQLQLAEKLLKDGLNWEYLILKARRNYVSPLIYKNLLKFNGLVAPEVLEGLKTAYILQRLSNERRYQDLGEILKAFRQEEIPVLLYKGVVLAQMVYQDVGLRPMRDFDLLVRPQDWVRTHKILFQFGYSGISPATISKVPKEYHLGYGNKKGTGLEFRFWLFWLDLPDFKKQDVWRNSRLATIAGEKALIPHPEDHLLLLSLSLLRQRYKGLIWFSDIAEFIRHYSSEIKWERIQEKAREKRISTFVYYGLLLTKQLLGAQIPDEALSSLKPDPLQCKLFTRYHLIDNILRLQPQTEMVYSSAKNQLFQLLLIDKLSLNPKVLLKTLCYFFRSRFFSK